MKMRQDNHMACPLSFRHIPVMAILEAGLRGKRLLLTGSTGFFGRWLLALLDELNRRGAAIEVSAVSRNPSRFLEDYPHYHHCGWLHWLTCDVRELCELPAQSFDLILHAAADTSAAAHAHPLELFDSIVDGARSVLDLTVRSGAQRILFTGSGAQYGALPLGQPARETTSQACNSIAVGNAYGEAKRAQETLAAIYAEQFGIDVVLTRCFAFAGDGLPLDEHFAIGNFVRDALFADAIVLKSSGESVRSYLHGSDLAAWLLYLLLEGASGEVYNVGSDQPISIAELAARVGNRLAPHKPILIFGQPGNTGSYYVPDIDKARVLGLDVWTSLDEAIDDMGRGAVGCSVDGVKNYQTEINENNMMAASMQKEANLLEEGKTFNLTLSSGRSLPVCWSRQLLRDAQEFVLIDRPERLEVLRRLSDYPYMHALLDADCLDYAKRRKVQVCQWLDEGIYLFGAYKVGIQLVQQAREAGVTIRGILDNDPAKQGCILDGILVNHPSEVSLETAVVLVASGHHSNAIHAQLNQIVGIRLLNMCEFLYALDASYITGSFLDFVEAPAREKFHYISAFLRMDDERSRQVFDKLIGMRTTLSIALADQVKSPYGEEYFDEEFVSSSQAARFVDAGAAAGDTLEKLEGRFGSVEQAWLFEPELPAYYEGLKRFSGRSEVWLFNMGLDEAASRAIYSPELSYDFMREIKSDVPAGITSYIQGVPLDSIVSGRVGLFKLDIEGMEARALRGGKGIIARDKPVIAVCAYHRADDYWKLIDEVLSIRQDYRIGIRLYADILVDITLYFY